MAHRPDALLALKRAALWSLFAAHLIGYWGVLWDTLWHVRIGRDSFWIAPHIMVYTGVTLAVSLAFGVLAYHTVRHKTSPPAVRILGLSGTPGFHVAAWGLAVTVLAAPFDELWHRLFGLDVTIWSPPHLMGLLGAAASAAACLLIAREVYPAEYRLRLAAMILAASLTYAYLQFMVGPATRIAYLYGGVLFYAYPILAALVLPPVLVVTARVSGQRAAPVLVLLTLATIVLVGHRIADVGFALLRPVSIVEAEIVKDPTSPIGVAHAIAAKSGTDPGHLAPGALLIAVALPTVMVAADARRRPVVASVVYAATVFAVSAAILPNSPAFRPLSPSVAETLLALTLTVAAALVAGQAARWRV